MTLTRWLPPLVLFLLPCLLLWRVVFGGEVFLPADLLRDFAPWRTGNPSEQVPWNPLMWDGMAEFYPWRLFAAQSLRQGWIPLWNPHQFCGTPFVANSQSAVFYPLNLLFLVLPVARAFGVSVILHLLLTGLFLFGFLRSDAVKLRRAPALLGAVVWQMSTWQASWLPLPTFLCVSTWLPLALWLTHRAARRPTALRAAGLGACLGVMLLAGHLQIAFYCLLLVAAYAVFRVVGTGEAPTAPNAGGVGWRWRIAGCTLLTGALMFGLVAPQLLPALELARASHRAGAALNWPGYEGYVRLALPVINLVTLFLPKFFGDPTRGTYWGLGTNGGPSAYMENACYVGIAALLLALVGVALTWRASGPTRFFAIAAVAALLLALGTPLDALLYFGIPGFAQSGSPGRILVLWTFCAAVLSAVGAQALVYRARTADGPRPRPLSLPRERAVRGEAAALGVFGLLFLLSFGYTAYWVGENAPAGTLGVQMAQEGTVWRLAAGVLVGGAALYWLRRRGTLTAGVTGGLLVALAAADLLGVNIGLNRSAPAGAVYPVTPGIAALQRDAGYERVMPLNRGWSLDGARPPQAVLPPNAATVYGLHDTQGYDSLLTGRYFAFARAMNGGQGPAPPENGNMVFTDDPASPAAQEAAARYVASREPLPSDSALQLIGQDPGMLVYANTHALPRARVTAGAGSAEIVGETPTRLALRISGAGTAGALVVADQWYPGWRAWVNGRPAAMEAGPDVFRTVRWAGLPAPAGGAAVEMRYWPGTFRVGLYGLCVAVATLAATAVCARRLRGRGAG